MSQTIQRTTVLPGHRIEICVPELPEGRSATVVVTLDDDIPQRPFWSVVGDYPGGQLFGSAEEVDAYLAAERNSWDS